MYLSLFGVAAVSGMMLMFSYEKAYALTTLTYTSDSSVVNPGMDCTYALVSWWYGYTRYRPSDSYAGGYCNAQTMATHFGAQGFYASSTDTVYGYGFSDSPATEDFFSSSDYPTSMTEFGDASTTMSTAIANFFADTGEVPDYAQFEIDYEAPTTTPTTTPSGGGGVAYATTTQNAIETDNPVLDLFLGWMILILTAWGVISFFKKR